MGQTIIRTTLTVLRLALEKLDSLLFVCLTFYKKWFPNSK
jgi:hypothetical protein